ncbi:MAG: hypothetical protein ACR2O3_03950 [Rhizobiaceae bacterium]
MKNSIMRSELDAGEFGQRKELVLLVLFSSTLISMATFLVLFRIFIPLTEPVSIDLKPVIWVSAFGISLVWSRHLLARFTPLDHPVSRIGVLLLLLFLPWMLFRIMPADIARLLSDLTFALLAIAGIIIGIRSLRPGKLALAGIFGIVFAAALFTALLGKEYISPIAYENALANVQHRDTLFHAAIAGMIEFHGSVSSGVDGLVPHAYHVLSHRLIGSVGSWLEIPVLQASYLTVMIVTVPLMFLLLCEAASALRPQGWPPLFLLPGIMFFLSWPMLFSLFQNSSYFASESYILSLVIMFSLFPLLVDWVKNPPDKPRTILNAAILALVIGLASAAKISTGAVMAAGLSTFVVIVGRFSVLSFLSAIVFCVAPFLLVFFTSLGSGEGTSGIISPLHFLLERREQALFYIFLTALAGFAIWRFMDRNDGSWRLIIPVYLMAIVSLCASLLLKLPAGAVIYFANPGMWICILLLAMLLPGPAWSEGKSRAAQYSIAMAVFVGLAAVEKDRWQAMEALSDIAPATMSEKTSQMQLNLAMSERIKRQVSEYGREFLVFVDPGFDQFWEQNEICWAQSFVIPGLTGQPMLKGVPPQIRDCEIPPYYGFSDYDLDDSRAEELADNNLCTVAKTRQFNAVLRFDDQTGRFIVCEN